MEPTYTKIGTDERTGDAIVTYSDADGDWRARQKSDGTIWLRECLARSEEAQAVLDAAIPPQGPTLEDRLAALESLQPDQDALAEAQAQVVQLKQGGIVATGGAVKRVG